MARPTEIDTNNDLGKSYTTLMQIAPIIFQHEGKGEMAGILLDQEHPQTTLELDGFRTSTVRSRRGLRSGHQEGIRAPVIALGNDEFLGAGTGFCISFSPKEAGAKRVGISYIDEGTFSSGAWVPGRRLNGDEDDQGKCWRFIPKQIHIEKASLYRYR